MPTSGPGESRAPCGPQWQARWQAAGRYRRHAPAAERAASPSRPSRSRGPRTRRAIPTVIADGAYLGTGLIVPHRKRAGRPLLRGQQEDNAEHRRVRARVEHSFARMKNWKILRDCRQKGDGLHHAVQAVATMHNLAMTR
ncbi:hypothetical protein GCM10010425_50340 [Streptomyces spororaveus]|uniref:DDE Tnp4 domain-containing protein n=1 Tax=Streptomyces spororaveus TaxID=284039 RepID=A0ABQ3T2L3_9ACTN|nr:hypothetical protein Sspor_01890 [Streptomyces spororaveus]